jgi:hypothetical protein
LLTVAECRFNLDTPNVVHMTVKPQDIAEEEEGGKGMASGREQSGLEPTTGCRCIVM